MPRYTKSDHERASSMLAHIQPGMTVYYILRKVTRAGHRYYDFYTFQENTPNRLTWPIAVMLGYGLSDATLRTTGYANDVIYNLSYHLFHHEYTLKGEEL